MKLACFTNKQVSINSPICVQRKSSGKELAAARTPKIFVIARNVLFYNEKWPRSAIHPLARTEAKPFVVLIAAYHKLKIIIYVKIPLPFFEPYSSILIVH